MVYQLRRVVTLKIIAFLIEDMTILSDLYNMVARQHAEGELTLEVGGDRSFSSAYLTSVNEERDTVDRDAGTVVEYEAGELHIVLDEELYIVDEVRARLRTEGDGADIGIATTGLAGPSGGTEEKPVGTVYVGISTRNDTKSFELRLGEKLSREEIRVLSAEKALSLALKIISENQ